MFNFKNPVTLTNRVIAFRYTFQIKFRVKKLFNVYQPCYQNFFFISVIPTFRQIGVITNS